MPSYTAAALVLAGAAVVVDVVVLRTRLITGLAWWLAYPIVLGFQLLSNGVLSSAGVVHYAPGAISGLRVFHAPVEDIGFGFALVLATLSIWVRLGRTGAGRDPAD